MDYERWLMNIKSIQLLKSRKSTWQHYCIMHRKISAARNENKAIMWHSWQTYVTSEERQTPPLHSLSGKSFIRRENSDSVKIKSFSSSWSQQDSQVALSVIRPSYSLISSRLQTSPDGPQHWCHIWPAVHDNVCTVKQYKTHTKKESSKRSRLL